MSNKKGRPKAEIDLEAFAKLAALQCTQPEIAGFFEVSVDTIQRRIADDPEYAEAWACGRDKSFNARSVSAVLCCLRPRARSDSQSRAHHRRPGRLGTRHRQAPGRGGTVSQPGPQLLAIMFR